MDNRHIITRLSYLNMTTYMICGHTCAGDCINTVTGSILWASTKGTCARHAANGNVHKNCNRQCPGFLSLNGPGKPTHKGFVRRATPEEVDWHLLLPTPIDQEVEIPTARTAGSGFRKIRVLYVADPVLEEPNRHRAKTDIGFISTIISEKDWGFVKHLKGHVHAINPDAVEVKVIIQEWVRIMILQVIQHHQVDQTK